MKQVAAGRRWGRLFVSTAFIVASPGLAASGVAAPGFASADPVAPPPGVSAADAGAEIAAEVAAPFGLDRAGLAIIALEDRRESGPELLGYLRSEDPDIRARAALAVGRVGRAADVNALTPLLQDPETPVRQWAAFALGEIEDSTAAVPLARLILDGGERDAGVRALAVEGLGKLRQGTDACRAALADGSSEVRGRALMAAWQIPVPGILDEVIRLALDPDPDVRWRAAYCLMRLAGAPASGATPIARAAELTPIERDRIEAALRRRVTDADARVRLQAVRGLRSFGSDIATATLLSTGGDPEWQVRVEVVRALASRVTTGAGDAPRAVDAAFVAPFLSDDHPLVRIVAVEALGTVLPADDAMPLLLERLDAPEPRVREVALGALIARWRETGDPVPRDTQAEIERVCRRMLETEPWTVRAQLVDACELLDAVRSRPILESLLRDDSRVAKLAVQPFLTIRAGEETGPVWSRLQPDLSELMLAQDPMVRLMTIHATGEIFAADSLHHASGEDWNQFDQLMMRTYADSRDDPALADLREGVVEVAAGLTERDAMRRVLESACRDPNHNVQTRAAAALRAAGRTPPIEPGPVATGRTASDYRHILDWAGADHWAVIETETGRIVLELFSRDAPLTAWNFASLANSGFYDDGAWHRVVPDFVLQDGCPRGDGWGGPPWQIRCEINRRPYVRGALGMALSGKDTGGSQFFITHSDQPHLDGRYTVFGRVSSGMAAADRVVQGMAIRSIRVVDDHPVDDRPSGE